MKDYIFLVFLLVFVLSFRFSTACHCSISYSFCHTAQRANVTTVMGEVLNVDSMNLVLLVQKVYQGQEQRDTIVIWADATPPPQPHPLCNIPMYAFVETGQVGQTVILNIERITPSNLRNPWDVIGDYRRLKWFCEENSLVVANDTVYSNENGVNASHWIVPYGDPLFFLVKQIPFSHFDSIWDNGIMDCSSIVATMSDNEIISLPIFWIAHGELNIRSISESGRLTLYNTLGDRLLDIMVSEEREISLLMFPKGIILGEWIGANGSRKRVKLLNR